MRQRDFLGDPLQIIMMSEKGWTFSSGVRPFYIFIFMVFLAAILIIALGAAGNYFKYMYENNELRKKVGQLVPPGAQADLGRMLYRRYQVLADRMTLGHSGGGDPTAGYSSSRTTSGKSKAGPGKTAAGAGFEVRRLKAAAEGVNESKPSSRSAPPPQVRVSSFALHPDPEGGYELSYDLRKSVQDGRIFEGYTMVVFKNSRSHRQAAVYPESVGLAGQEPADHRSGRPFKIKYGMTIKGRIEKSAQVFDYTSATIYVFAKEKGPPLKKFVLIRR